MNLVLDIGNNYFKLGIFDNSKLIHNISNENNEIENEILKVISNYKLVSHVLISNVSSYNLNSLFEKKDFKIYDLKYTFNLPFTISYKTPQTLGNDRIALAAAATVLYPNSNNIIIDAGTCITIDFLNDKNIFFGGSISPGIQMRYQSLNSQTAKLPLLNKSSEIHFPGNSTENSIHSGVIGGICHEIMGFVKQINSDYKDVNVILTGGDAKFLSKTLKITIFANQIFILEGLNSILNLNKQ